MPKFSFNEFSTKKKLEFEDESSEVLNKKSCSIDKPIKLDNNFIKKKEKINALGKFLKSSFGIEKKRKDSIEINEFETGMNKMRQEYKKWLRKYKMFYFKYESQSKMTSESILFDSIIEMKRDKDYLESSRKLLEILILKVTKKIFTEYDKKIRKNLNSSKTSNSSINFLQSSFSIIKKIRDKESNMELNISEKYKKFIGGLSNEVSFQKKNSDTNNSPKKAPISVSSFMNFLKSEGSKKISKKVIQFNSRKSSLSNNNSDDAGYTGIKFGSTINNESGKVSIKDSHAANLENLNSINCSFKTLSQPEKRKSLQMDKSNEKISEILKDFPEKFEAKIRTTSIRGNNNIDNNFKTEKIDSNQRQILEKIILSKQQIFAETSYEAKNISENNSPFEKNIKSSLHSVSINSNIKQYDKNCFIFQKDIKNRRSYRSKDTKASSITGFQPNLISNQNISLTRNKLDIDVTDNIFYLKSKLGKTTGPNMMNRINTSSNNNRYFAPNVNEGQAFDRNKLVDWPNVDYKKIYKLKSARVSLLNPKVKNKEEVEELPQTNAEPINSNQDFTYTNPTEINTSKHSKKGPVNQFGVETDFNKNFKRNEKMFYQNKLVSEFNEKISSNTKNRTDISKDSQESKNVPETPKGFQFIRNRNKTSSLGKIEQPKSDSNENPSKLIKPTFKKLTIDAQKKNFSNYTKDNMQVFKTNIIKSKLKDHANKFPNEDNQNPKSCDNILKGNRFHKTQLAKK